LISLVFYICANHIKNSTIIPIPLTATISCYLRDQPVQISVCGTLNIEGSSADVIDGFIIEKHGNISVLEEGVGRKDAVVRFHDRGGNLGRGINGETEL